jgi:hypothetical protein
MKEGGVDDGGMEVVIAALIHGNDGVGMIEMVRIMVMMTVVWWWWIVVRIMVIMASGDDGGMVVVIVA